MTKAGSVYDFPALIIDFNLSSVLIIWLIALYSDLMSTDPTVPRHVVQSCRSVGVCPACDPAEFHVINCPRQHPQTILQSQPTLGASRWWMSRFTESLFLLKPTPNNPSFAHQVAVLSWIHSATVHHSRYVTPQGAVAWASTGVTCLRAVCTPEIPAALMML